MITQPMTKPETIAEFEAMKSRMIDTRGRPLASEFCSDCETTHFTVEPCVSEVPCPDCGSRRLRCIRPSGHDATEWHASRIATFDEIRNDREAAGIAQVAVWPREPIDELFVLLNDERH